SMSNDYTHIDGLSRSRKHNELRGFTQCHRAIEPHTLHEHMESAIVREKRIKKYMLDSGVRRNDGDCSQKVGMGWAALR
ncbi:MAG: hypothetical protein ABIH23_01285, partial [bacterium]